MFVEENTDRSRQRQQIKHQPLCPPPFFAIFKYAVSFSTSTELVIFGDLGLEHTVTISEKRGVVYSTNKLFPLKECSAKYGFDTTVLEWIAHFLWFMIYIPVPYISKSHGGLQFSPLGEIGHQLVPFLACVSPTSTPSWVYHWPSFLSNFAGSGVGLCGSIVNKSIDEKLCEAMIDQCSCPPNDC